MDCAAWLQPVRAPLQFHPVEEEQPEHGMEVALLLKLHVNENKSLVFSGL